MTCELCKYGQTDKEKERNDSEAEIEREQKVGGYRRGPRRLYPDIGIVRYFHRAHTEETMRVKIEENQRWNSGDKRE
ncbi:hypothetical protein K0M31_014365 [Melipona bicolor]|uniref:Uncharacterized protein n=1 Tax=Melipona bicolor TaxID=60889 RepID=A0AA40G8N3_9HYME|nr:hypothetical protein K0M31_014365 [Melipona bicolor]